MAVSDLSDRFAPIKFSRSIICLLVASATTATAVEVAGFQGLGFLSETDTYSKAHGISADGSTVVGGSSIDGYLWSYRWSGGLMTAIPKSNAAEVPLSEAYSVSADGSVIVGMEYNLATNTTTGYRWSQSEGLLTLPYETGTIDNNYGTANAVSGDGLVITGAGPSSFRWTEADDITSLPLLPGGENGISHVHGISQDGAIIVGASPSAVGTFAFVWTEENGTQLLDVPGASWSEAMGISSDGSTIVGTFTVGASLTETAFAWTALGVVTMSSLSMDEGTVSHAYAVTGDGLWAVGVSDELAALWNTQSGEVWDLNVLAAGQSGFGGWTLGEATGVSADGRRIVGNGFNAEGAPEAWVLDLTQIPEPSSAALLAMGSVAILRRRKR